MAIVYGADLLFDGGGTASADTVYGDDDESWGAALACDNNAGTRWLSKITFPHWWKYDFSEGVAKIVSKLTLLTFHDVNGARVKDFTLDGSNNDSDWDTVYTGQMADNGDTQIFTFSNDVAYRYYRVNVTSTWKEEETNSTFYTIEMAEMVRTLSQAVLID